MNTTMTPAASGPTPIIPMSRLMARRPGGSRFDGLSLRDSAVLMAWDTYSTANALLQWAAEGVPFDNHELTQAAFVREIGRVMLGTSMLPKGV